MIAQAILNLFPDAISQFGLIGCWFATVEVVGILALILLVVRRLSLR